MDGVSASSPPSPMISGGALAKPTVRFFFNLGRPLALAPTGSMFPPSAALLTSAASGHLWAIATSILGAGNCRVPAPEYFSVDGLRKSTTSSLNPPALLLISGEIVPSLAKTFPHLLLNLLLLAAAVPSTDMMRWGVSKCGGRRKRVGRVCCFVNAACPRCQQLGKQKLRGSRLNSVNQTVCRRKMTVEDRT